MRLWDFREFSPGEAAYAVREYVAIAFDHGCARRKSLLYAATWCERAARLHPDAHLTPFLRAVVEAVECEAVSAGQHFLVCSYVTDVAFDALFGQAGLEPFFFTDTAP